MFLPNKPLFFFFSPECSQGSANLKGDFGLSTVRDFLPLYTGVLCKIISGLFFVHARPNPIGYLSSMQSCDIFLSKALKSEKGKLTWLKLSGACWYCNHRNAQTLPFWAESLLKKHHSTQCETLRSVFLHVKAIKNCLCAGLTLFKWYKGNL